MSCNNCAKFLLCDKKDCAFRPIRDIKVTKIGDDEIVQNKIRKFK